MTLNQSLLSLEKVCMNLETAADKMNRLGLSPCLICASEMRRQAELARAEFLAAAAAYREREKIYLNISPGRIEQVPEPVQLGPEFRARYAKCWPWRHCDHEGTMVHRVPGCLEPDPAKVYGIHCCRCLRTKKL